LQLMPAKISHPVTDGTKLLVRSASEFGWLYP
jgi:hypothetical protein